jgi:hypothetical protein
MDYAKFAFKTSLKAHNASSSLLNPKMLTHFGNPEKSMWGCSSVGRAPALQAGGQEFDSPHLHHVATGCANQKINKLIFLKAPPLLLNPKMLTHFGNPEDYAKFAFKTSLKAHNASSSLLNPKKNSFIFLKETLEEWKCSYEHKESTLKTKQRQDF